MVQQFNPLSDMRHKLTMSTSAEKCRLKRFKNFLGKKKLNRNLLGVAASAAAQSTSTANHLKITQSVIKYPETVAKNESGNVTSVIENDTGTRQSAAEDE
ncbi:hypothetical protein ACH3XW_29395 [Acanthocheilonema viteae]